MTATADKAVTAASETLIPASSRVSLLVGEQHQIDLLLPAAVPLHRLAEPTRDAINQRLRSIGACGPSSLVALVRDEEVVGSPGAMDSGPDRGVRSSSYESDRPYWATRSEDATEQPVRSQSAVGSKRSNASQLLPTDYMQLTSRDPRLANKEQIQQTPRTTIF